MHRKPPFIRHSFSEGGQNISIQSRPNHGRFFHYISLREKNGGRLTKVNSFFCNHFIINMLRQSIINFRLMGFLAFSGYLRQYLTTLSDSALNETIEKKINTELIIPLKARLVNNFTALLPDCHLHDNTMTIYSRFLSHDKLIAHTFAPKIELMKKYSIICMLALAACGPAEEGQNKEQHDEHGHGHHHG